MTRGRRCREKRGASGPKCHAADAQHDPRHLVRWAPFPARSATIAELLISVASIVGFRLRWTSLANAARLGLFAVAVAFALFRIPAHRCEPCGDDWSPMTCGRRWRLDEVVEAIADHAEFRRSIGKPISRQQRAPLRVLRRVKAENACEYCNGGEGHCTPLCRARRTR